MSLRERIYPMTLTTSEKDTKKILRIVFFAILASIVPVLIVYDIYNQWRTLEVDFCMDRQDYSVVGNILPGGKAEAAGLQVGDVILAADSIPFECWHELEAGHTYILKIERKGEQLAVSVPVVRAIEINAFSLVSTVIVVLAFWAVGVLLLWQRFWHPEIRMLFFLSHSFAIALIFPLSYLDPWHPPFEPLSLSVAALILSVSLLFHYAITFPIKLGRARQRLWGLTLLYGVAVVALMAWLSQSPLGAQISASYSFIVAAAAMVIIVFVQQRQATPDERRRFRVIIFGITFAGLPPLFLYLLPAAIHSPKIIPDWAASLFLIIAPLSYLYATLRHNLFGIDRLINRTLVYTLLFMGIFSLYLGPYLLLFRYIPVDFFVHMVIVSGLMLWVGWTFDWARTRVQRLVDRLFYGGWYDYPVVVETITDALARSIDREQINDVLTRRVPDLMQLDGARLWIGDPKDTSPAMSSFSARFRFKFRSDVPAQWAVGLHRGGDDLSDMDRRILNTLARQAEVALNNALLIETLRRQLDEINASREALSLSQRQLLRSREDERARLARELHDSPLQSLVGLNIHLGMLLDTERITPPLVGSLNEMRAEIRRLSAELRQVCAELRPPMLDTLGLGASLRALTSEWSEQHDIDMQLILPPDATLRSLPDEVIVNLYRVAQEALTNIAKHARAQRANLSLNCEAGQMEMIIQDDGQGFRIPDPLQRLNDHFHFGLTGMRERVDLIGGQWSLKSAPGEGTTVKIVLYP